MVDNLITVAARIYEFANLSHAITAKIDYILKQSIVAIVPSN
jgi:hypothetical protein